MRRIILFFVLSSIMSIAIWAECGALPSGTTWYQGLYYQFFSGDAVRIMKNSWPDEERPQYTGDIIIPEYIEYICPTSGETEWAKVTEIYNDAFKNCVGIISVECESTTPPQIESNAFDGCTNLVHIYVPYKAINTYKSTKGWSQWANIITSKDYDLESARENAISSINTAKEGIENTSLLELASGSIQAISTATTIEQILEIQKQTLPILLAYQEGKRIGYKQAVMELPTEQESVTEGVEVVIKKGDKTLSLINPESVEYRQYKEE